jgi:hypothetical protein
MVSIAAALRQIKEDPFGVLKPSVIEAVCDELDYTWRDGPLNPAYTMALFVQQIVEGNVSCAHVCRLSDRKFSPPAYCEARRRLPLEVPQELSRRVIHAVRKTTEREKLACRRWHGLGVWLLDGSGFSMPDTPELRDYFGLAVGQKEGCGFPVGHMLAMFDWQSGLLEEPVISPGHTHDLRHVGQMHAKMNERDVLLVDSAFNSWGHFALILQRNLHLIAPAHSERIVDFTPGRRHTTLAEPEAGLPRSCWMQSLGKDDQLVQWPKPRKCPKWMKREDYDKLPERITVREIRRTIRRAGFRPITVTVATTLLDPELYPADEIVALRMQRWAVETDLRHLKTTMKMDVLRCKTVAGVSKEVAVFTLVYNLVRALMLEAATRQKAPVSRISFADALHWLQHAKPDDPFPTLIVNPARPGRIEPRVVKRRPKNYRLMTKPRAVLRQLVLESTLTPAGTKRCIYA